MNKKLLVAVALFGLLATAGAFPVLADDPPPAETDGVPQADDPDAQPYPPDGVTDPNVTYPTDGAEGTDQGETGPPPPSPAPPIESQPGPDGSPDAEGQPGDGGRAN